MLRSWLLVGILGLCPALSLAQDVRPAAKLPVVKSGDMPFYPPLLRTAQVEGEVDLRVTTDGSSVVSATLDYGNLLLVKAAQDNVRTWKFVPRQPTSFSTVFVYQLRVEPKCQPNKSDNSEIRLELPTRAEITANARGSCYDPNDELDLSEPLRVFLTGCELDGSPISCERVTFRLYSGSVAVIPTRFKESKREGFVVPKEFRNLKNYSLTVEIGRRKL